MISKEELIAYVEELVGTVERTQAHRSTLVDELERLYTAIRDARNLLYDYDGYYDETTKAGDAENLGRLIDEVYAVLTKALHSRVQESLEKVNTKHSTTLKRLAERDTMDYEFLYLKTQKLQKENDALRDTVELLEADLDHVTADRDNLTIFCNGIVEARDQARRMYCELAYKGTACKTPQAIAEQHLWYCYDDVNKNNYEWRTTDGEA